MAIFRFQSTLLAVEEVAPDLKKLHFSVPESFSFKQGQYLIAILHLPSGEIIRRQYSIAHHEHQKVAFVLDLVPGGLGSAYLLSLKIGDSVELQGPLGAFYITEKDLNKDICFIATGTGIAPFAAMIPFLLKKGTTGKILLFAGYRYEKHILFNAEFEHLVQVHQNFLYKTIISRPEVANYAGETGRVQTLIERYLPADFNGDIYLCGLRQMIEEVGKLLAEKGIYSERIHFEPYN